jgi:hypothetical protein
MNTAGVWTPGGPSVSLGQLNYTFLQPGGGAFNLPVFSTGTLGAVPATDGILSLTGQMWIAGDPFELNVTTVPEPSTMGLAVAGVLAFAVYRLRKRTKSARLDS